MEKDFKSIGVRAIYGNGNVIFDGKTLDIEKIQDAEFTPENLNIDNDNALLKPENHNKELSLTLDVQPTKKLLRLFKNNIFCKLRKIRKKYHSPKRRVQKYNKFFEREKIVSINDIDTSKLYFKINS